MNDSTKLAQVTFHTITFYGNREGLHTEPLPPELHFPHDYVLRKLT
ncbi:hypothetical protein PYCH_00360 [Pyrococcus yayanosii CH1]|uniref:Uncharacterized protein n=1 Tax=Pyrococcus yayanosii (strain CH1 / JCM 16557) TaxID=529709 RepID=F8AFE2_PYRYC|nr:hypothetical protein PYCH_00360 [Pyrococcus yayanosii CH1]